MLQVAPLPNYVRPSDATLLKLQSEASAVTDAPAESREDGDSEDGAGVGGASSSGGAARRAKRIHIPWPLSDVELAALLEPYDKQYRVLHLVDPDKLLGLGFEAPGMMKAYAGYVQSLTSRWCCRATVLLKAKGLGRHVEFMSVPEKWRSLLPPKPDAYTLARRRGRLRHGH